MFSVWTMPYSLGAVGFVSLVQSAPEAPAWPVGTKAFPKSDFILSRRASYYSSVHMSSSRVGPTETVGNENTKGRRLGDGMFYLSLNGREYFDNERLATLDWKRLPGITVEQHAATADNHCGGSACKSSKSFVGGANLNGNGVAAMDLLPPGSSITQARKGWVFFDDAIVFFNRDIRATGGNSIETVINQWPLSTVSAPLHVDGVAQPATAGWQQTFTNPGWVVAEGMGYWFPSGGAINIKRAAQAGSWRAINPNSPTTVHTNPFLTLWVSHGASPTGANLKYVIAPNQTAFTMANWVSGAPLDFQMNVGAGGRCRSRSTQW